MASRHRNRGRDVSGIILLDKPIAQTSNASLQNVKRLFSAAKAGHTGSLDPLATGVLPLCFGEATKISQFLLDSDKRYRSKFKLGVRTNTGDSEGSVLQCCELDEVLALVSVRKIEQALKNFEGEIDQLPPMFCALKHQGVPLYKLARQGIEVERATRRVTIYDIQILTLDNDELELEIFCSKGTYIRSIADELGELLGCGAHVIELRRLQAGPFHEQHCISIAELEKIKEQGGYEALDKQFIGVDKAVQNLPEVVLPESSASYIKNGQAVMVRHLPTTGLVRLYKKLSETNQQEQEFIGIGAILEDGRVAPRRLFNLSEKSPSMDFSQSR